MFVNWSYFEFWNHQIFHWCNPNVSGCTFTVNRTWFLPPAYVVRRKVIVSLCLSVHTWGGGGGGQVQPGGVSGLPDRGGGVRSSWRGGGVRSSQRGGGRSGPADGGGGPASCALLRAVCLLRSRRRTFLLFRVALLEDVNSIAAETDCQAGFISKGISMACFYYARCLQEGRGVQKDEVESKTFYTKVGRLHVCTCNSYPIASHSLQMPYTPQFLSELQIWSRDVR